MLLALHHLRLLFCFLSPSHCNPSLSTAPLFFPSHLLFSLHGSPLFPSLPFSYPGPKELLEEGGFIGGGRMESAMQKRQSVSQATHAASRKKEDDKVELRYLVLRSFLLLCAILHTLQIQSFLLLSLYFSRHNLFFFCKVVSAIFSSSFNRIDTHTLYKISLFAFFSSFSTCYLFQ